MPSTATMVAMPRATPTADSTARAGLLARPRTASGQASAARRRLVRAPAAAAAQAIRRRLRGAARPHAAPLSCSIRPSRSRITRPVAAAISGSWVTTRIVVPLAVQLGEQGEDARARRRVQAAGRLVGQDDGRPPDQGPGDGHPLALAAGQLGGAVTGPVGQADLGQRVRGGLRAAAARARPGTAGRPPRCRARSGWAAGRTAGTRTRSGSPGRRPGRGRAARPRPARPPGRCPRSGVPACRRSPAWSTCPTRTGPTIAANSPAPIVTVTDLSAATGGDPGAPCSPRSARAQSLGHHHLRARPDARPADLDLPGGEQARGHADEMAGAGRGDHLQAVAAARQREQRRDRDGQHAAGRLDGQGHLHLDVPRRCRWPAAARASP